MTAPRAAVRKATYRRDSNLCVTCGVTTGLQWQHREASGSGGRGRKAPALTAADGVTSCWSCNARYEADLQSMALRFGWKLRRNRGGILASQVPFFVRWCGEWWLPDDVGGKQVIGEAEALELVAVAGGIPGDGVIF